MKTAKAAVFTGVDKEFEIREYPLTVPTQGMARLKLISSGICGTDVHIHKGRIPIQPPKIIGHEFVGCVEEISREDSEKYGISAGDNAIVDIACPCGECLLCKNGDDANCVNLGVTNGGDPEVAPHFYGGYGEYNYSPVKNLVKIPPELDAKLVSAYSCAGPTAIHAFSLAEKAGCHLERSRVAVVQGIGPVGSFAVMYLAAMGIPEIIVITAGNNDEREKFAYKLGATRVYNIERTDIEDITAEIREISGGIGADLVFEASGSRQAVPQGMGLLRLRGVYLIPGQYSNSGGIEIQPQLITFNALQLIGSSQYSISDVEKYIAFLGKNTRLHPIIKSIMSEYTVDRINEAFEDIRNGKNIKTVLAPAE